jgi:hypothetical protein
VERDHEDEQQRVHEGVEEEQEEDDVNDSHAVAHEEEGVEEEHVRDVGTDDHAHAQEGHWGERCECCCECLCCGRDEDDPDQGERDPRGGHTGWGDDSARRMARAGAGDCGVHGEENNGRRRSGDGREEVDGDDCAAAPRKDKCVGECVGECAREWTLSRCGCVCHPCDRWTPDEHRVNLNQKKEEEEKKKKNVEEEEKKKKKKKAEKTQKPKQMQTRPKQQEPVKRSEHARNERRESESVHSERLVVCSRRSGASYVRLVVLCVPPSDDAHTRPAR